MKTGWKIMVLEAKAYVGGKLMLEKYGVLDETLRMRSEEYSPSRGLICSLSQIPLTP